MSNIIFKICNIISYLTNTPPQIANNDLFGTNVSESGLLLLRNIPLFVTCHLPCVFRETLPPKCMD